MATLGSLIISLEANTAKFEAAMTKAEYTAQKAASALKSAFIGIGTTIVAAFSVSEIIGAVTEIAKMEGQLLKTAGKLNTTVETLSSFGIAMRKTGMDADSFYTALTRMEKGMSAAAAKSEISTGKFSEEGEEIMKTSSTYDELGINVDKLIKLPLDQQLTAIAEAFKNNIDPADRVRISMELFGKSGAGMVNILKGGASDLQGWINQQKDLGIITEDAAKKASQFNNEVANLTTQWEHFKREILEGVIPALASLIEKINQAIAASREARTNLAIYEEHFKGVEYQGYYAPSFGVGPFGEAAGEPGAVSQIPYKPPSPDLFKPPIRPGEKETGGRGGSGKGGGGDAGLDRMQSIIDTLQKDLSRLTEGSLAEIREWGRKTADEIEKVGRKGADTSTAMRLKDEVEKAKMKKATEDYEIFVAKESGDAFRQIEADNKEWLTKYKGFADSEVNIKKITERKKWEESSKQNADLLNLQKEYLDSIISEMPLLSKQLELRQKLIPIETRLMQIEMQRRLNQLRLTPEEKKTIENLERQAEESKKITLERQKWSTQGIPGGLKIASEEMKKGAEAWAAQQTAALVEKLPDQISSMIATSLVGFLQGKTPDLQALGVSIAESFIKTMMEGILNQIIPELVGALADALGGIMGGGGGGGIFGDIFGGIGAIFGFHSGGLISAHSGFLAGDERLIKVQTGERVLSRSQNRDYESGRAGGTTVYVTNNFPNQNSIEIDRFSRRLSRSIRREESRRVA